MIDNDEDMLSETLEDFKLKKPYQALTKLLQEIDTQNIDLDINQSKFQELKKIVNDIHESANDRGSYGNRDFYSFLSTIFKAERLIQSQNEKTISNLSQNLKANGKNNLRTGGNDIQIDVDIQNENSYLNENQSKASTVGGPQASSSKEDGRSEVIQSITEHFNLENNSNDLPALINNLDKLVAESSNNLVRKVAQSFNLPISTNSSNIVTNLKEKINETYGKQAQNQTRKEDVMLDSDSSAATPLSPSDDPTDPQVSKSQLISTVRSLRNQIVILKDSIVTQDAILREFEGIPIKTDEIENILISDAPILTKIKNIINILSLSLFASEDAAATNEKLLACVSGLFRFITSLGQSKNSYTSLYSETPFEEMRSILLLQTERVSIFLNDHGMGIAQDNSLFESLLHQTGSLNMLDSVNKYLRTYIGKPKTAEGQQLYVLLMEAVTACDILRKFATEASKTCKQQMNDVRQLKDYSKNLERSMETQHIETITHIQENNDKVDETVSTVRSILRNAVLNENLKDIRPVIQALDAISPKNDRKHHGGRNSSRRTQRNSLSEATEEDDNDFAYTSDENRRNDEETTDTENSKSHYDYRREINDTEYINSLQNQIYQARDTIQDLKKSRENLLKQTQSDFLKVREQVNKKLEETKQKFKEKKAENRKLFLALKDTSEKYETLKADYDELRKSRGINIESENDIETKSTKSNKSSKSNRGVDVNTNNNNNDNNEGGQENNDNNNDSDVDEGGFDDDQLKIIKEIQEQFIGTKEDYEKVLKSMRHEITEYQETKQREFDSAKESFEQILSKKQSQIDEEKQKYKLLRKKYDKLKEDVDKLNNKLVQSKQTEEEALDQAMKLSQKYQEIHDDFLSLEMAKNKIQEESDKTTNSMKNLLKEHIQLNDSYSQLSKELDDTRSNSTKVLQDTFSSIARLFPSYYDISMKLESDSIIQMLEKVRDKEKKLEKRENYLKQLNELLNVEKSSQLFEEVDNLKKKVNQVTEEAIEKAKENKALNDSRMTFLQIQDWLIRMYVLCSGGVCQDVTTAEMENTVEEVLLSSFGNLVQSRKMGILKAEKKLLSRPDLREELEGKSNEDSPNQSKSKNKKGKKVSLRHLLIMMMLLIKTKKLAGNMEQNTYDYETVGGYEKNNMNRNSLMNMTEEHTEDDIFPNSPTNQPLSPIMNYGSAFQ